MYQYVIAASFGLLSLVTGLLTCYYCQTLRVFITCKANVKKTRKARECHIEGFGLGGA